MRIGVSPIPAAAGPGMATAMDEPLLDHNLPGLVPSHRAGMSTGRGMPSLGALDALTFLGRPHDVAAFDGWTMLSASPWKTMVRMRGPSFAALRDFRDRRPSGPASPRIAANAEGRSAADL